MESEMIEIGKELDGSNSPKLCKSLRLRECLCKIMDSSPSLEIMTTMSDEGDITFMVNLADMNLKYGTCMQYKEEIFSTYLVNFLGELLVRENINAFAPILISLDNESYGEMVNRYSHKKFGVEISKTKNAMYFTFHISLLQIILTEDVRGGI